MQELIAEILHRRDYIGDIIINRIQRARDGDGNSIRIEQPESEWKIRKDEALRVVPDELWSAAHARVDQTKKSYLRRGHQLVGQVESTKGLYLLSGFLSCGVCGKPMIATRRGRSMSLVYVCREHRERGDAACKNTTGVPAADLNHTVIRALSETFTPETFRAHLEEQASNVEAKGQRAAERANLLAELPRLAAAEQRLVKRIATIEDDSLVAALKEEWQGAKASRERTERRITELEGIERDLAADRAEVEALLATWATWSVTLAQVESAPTGSVPAEAQAQARQVLKKVLAGSIVVTPSDEGGDWSFRGWSRFDGVILGGLGRSGAASITLPDRLPPTISGGSDAPVSAVRDPEMAPHTLHARHAPAKPWRSSNPPNARRAPAQPWRSSTPVNVPWTVRV